MTLTPATPAYAVSSLAYDAIAPNGVYIPRDAFAVGGYVNGVNTEFIWPDSLWAQFPNSYHIYINVNGDPTKGNALDIETGDATVANIVPWINHQAPIHKGPLLVYCNRANFAPVIAEVQNADSHAWIWEATDDGTLMPGRGMTQIAQMSVPGVAGPVADMSVIRDRMLRQLMAAA